MSWRVPKKCGGCPFATSGKGLKIRHSLRPSRWRQILNTLRNDGIFPCHETVLYDDDGEAIAGSGKICAGSLEWQEKHGHSSNFVRICERIDFIRQEKKDAKGSGSDVGKRRTDSPKRQ